MTQTSIHRTQSTPLGMPPHAQNGVVLIVLIVLVLAITTSSLIAARLSTNNIMTRNMNSSMDALSIAKDALMGFAINSTPPGTLPCPDTNGDGFQNLTAGSCQSQRGRLPYRTLGIPALYDGSESLLWYAVSLAYTPNDPGDKNSSRVPTLTLDGNDMAAIVIAPEEAINNQNRANSNTAAQYLEGTNADNTLSVYAQAWGDTENDTLLGLALSEFWVAIERSVLPRVGALLNDYRTACGEYPWAAPYGGSSDSTNALQQGFFPSQTALPADWNTGCAVGITLPTWLDTHWNDQLYYSMCISSDGQCMSVTGDQNTTAAAILIGPGIPLTGQNRAGGNQSDFFENGNATTRPPATAFNYLDPPNYSGTFNDTLYIVP